MDIKDNKITPIPLEKKLAKQANEMLDALQKIKLEKGKELTFKDHDTFVITNLPLGIVRANTNQAICLGFEGKNQKWDTWIPKSIITVESQQDTVRHHRNIKEFSVSLPTWFIEKNFRGLAENLK